MNTIRHQVIDGITVYKPTRDDVMNLQVGDFAPDAFGRLREVVGIYAKQDDIKGKAFVCYYTKQGENSSMSDDLKEDEIYIDLATTSKWSRTENIPWVD